MFEAISLTKKGPSSELNLQALSLAKTIQASLRHHEGLFECAHNIAEIPLQQAIEEAAGMTLKGIKTCQIPKTQKQKKTLRHQVSVQLPPITKKTDF